MVVWVDTSWTAWASPVQPRRVLESDWENSEMPYRYNGLIRVPNGRASGVVVHERVVLTAAHVIHSNGSWAQASFFPQHHRFYSEFNNQFYNSAGSHRWESYSSRVQRDGQISGSSRDTFNVDIAALFFLPRLLPGGAYAPIHVDGEGDISILREPFPKTVTGYPIGLGQSVGFLHSIQPADFLIWWDALTREPDGWYDSGVGPQPRLWKALYFTDDFLTYSGNSGGPVWVRDELDEWLASAVVVGFNNWTGNSYFRGIDDNAYQLIRAAAESSGGYRTQRPRELSAYAGGDGQVYLSWEAAGADIEAFRILRSDTGVWQVLATVSGERRTFIDHNVSSGREYRYKIQSLRADGARSPYSPLAAVQTRGWDHKLGRDLSMPWFAWRTLGDGPFYHDGVSLRSGRTRSMGFSALELELEGPGRVDFSWAVSSEENPDFDNPDSHLFGDIYDAFYFYLNDVEERWITGEVPEQALSFDLPGGRHRLRWEYRKDPYADEGEDAGRLLNLEWFPGNSAEPASQLESLQGTFSLGGQWRESPAIGPFWGGYLESNWIYHPAWGWSWLRLSDTGELFALRAETQDWLYWTSEHPRSYFCYGLERWIRF